MGAAGLVGPLSRLPVLARGQRRTVDMDPCRRLRDAEHRDYARVGGAGEAQPDALKVTRNTSASSVVGAIVRAL